MKTCRLGASLTPLSLTPCTQRRIDKALSAQAPESSELRNKANESLRPVMKSDSLLPVISVSQLHPSMASETLTVSPAPPRRPARAGRTTGRAFHLPRSWLRSKDASTPQAILMGKTKRTFVPNGSPTCPHLRDHTLGEQRRRDPTQATSHRVPRKPVSRESPQEFLVQHGVWSRFSNQSTSPSSIALADAVPQLPHPECVPAHFAQQDSKPGLSTAYDSQQQSTRSSIDPGR